MIGILYESNEWSDFKLRDELCALGSSVCMIDATDASAAKALAGCDVLVSRVFASSHLRGNEQALAHMPLLFSRAKELAIPVINSEAAHVFEISKLHAMRRLEEQGLATPPLQAQGLPEELAPDSFSYPCIIKPDCGGRSAHTALLTTEAEAEVFLQGVPSFTFIVQDYLVPESGHLIRVEVVGADAYVYTRSISANGLSSYHFGSVYERVHSPQQRLLDLVSAASAALEFEVGSFDLIEQGGTLFIIDANSVSNVSEDCTELLGIDLMRLHAEYISKRLDAMRSQVS